MRNLRSITASTAAVLALALTGCSAPNPQSQTDPQDEEEAQFVVYVECLQEQGVDASYTQDAEGQGHFDVDAVPDDPKFVAAQRACAEHVPQEMKKTLTAAELDALIEVAACMRKQGVDVEDPTVDEPGLRIRGSEEDSAKADEIRAACEKEVEG